MLTFKSLGIKLKDFLEENLNVWEDKKISIQFGKFGSMPSYERTANYGIMPIELPAILIYYEPATDTIKNSTGNISLRFARFDLFVCLFGEDNSLETAIESIRLAEKIEYLIKNNLISYLNDNETVINMSESPYAFDSFYSNIAVSYIEFSINYKNEFE